MRERRSHIFTKQKHHWYVEPERCTTQLVNRERFVGSTWDPCCGCGNVVRSLIAAGLHAFGTDLIHRCGRARWFEGTLDFLSDHNRTADNIVMNPPFIEAAGAEAFIRKAVTIARSKVAAFVELRFLGSDGRANGLFAEIPPARVYMITPRPSCPPGEYLAAGNKAEGGQADFVWIVWDNTIPRGNTGFAWLTAADT